MLKRILSVCIVVGVIILSLFITKQTLADFDMPIVQERLKQQASLQQQEQQEAPTAVTVPTLPAELWTQTATPGPDGYIKHTILEHQFLWNISELYGVPLAEIYQLNNLTEDSITYPGDVLIIKKIEEPTPEPTETLAPLASTEEAAVAEAFALEPTPELTPTNAVMPGTSKGLLERVFTNNSRYLAYGIFALVILGVVLLIVSSRRIY